MAELKQQLQEHAVILQYSGATERASMNIKFEELRQEHPLLYEYSRAFHHAIVNLFDAYRVLGTGLISANIERFEGMHYKALRKWGCYSADIAEIATVGALALGPFICAVHELTGDIYDLVMGRKFENKAEGIQKIIAAKLKYKELDIELGKVAFAITQAKKDEILNPPSAKKLSWLQGYLSYINEKTFGPSKEQENHVAELVLQDIALFITHLCKNHETMITNSLPFKEQVEALLAGTNLNNFLIDDVDTNIRSNLSHVASMKQILPAEDIVKINERTLTNQWKAVPAWHGFTLQRGIEDFLEQKYIQTICTNQILPWSPDLARIVIFGQMCKATAESGAQNFACLQKVSEKYPEIVYYIIQYCPKLFINNKIAEICIQDENFRQQVIEQLQENSQLALENGALEEDEGFFDDSNLMGDDET